MPDNDSKFNLTQSGWTRTRSKPYVFIFFSKSFCKLYFIQQIAREFQTQQNKF